MKNKDLILELQKCNPEADILVRDRLDGDEFHILAVDIDETNLEKTKTIMVWFDSRF